MVLPSTISDASPLDPLLLLPIPSSLPSSPIPDLDPLLSLLDSQLSSSSSKSNDVEIPLTALTSGMRRITRQTQILLNAARVGMAQAREKLDGVDVDLRGVEYERERIKEEIDRCSDYEPLYKTIDLQDVDTFLSSIDKSTRASLPSPDDPGYEYALTIARLEDELNEIQKREARVLQLTKERDALIRAKKEIKVKFDAVDVHLTGFSRSANAVASKLKDVADLPVSTTATIANQQPSAAATDAIAVSSSTSTTES